MKHSQKAREYFLKGYSCAQAVFMAYCDVTGYSEEEAARLSSSFGGGMGRMREVCGAVSGALMVLGLEKGYSDTSDEKAISDHYLLVQDFAERFREHNGSIICRELLEGVKVTEGKTPEKRTREYYESRPCLNLVDNACCILDEMLKR